MITLPKGRTELILKPERSINVPPSCRMTVPRVRRWLSAETNVTDYDDVVRSYVRSTSGLILPVRYGDE